MIIKLLTSPEVYRECSPKTALSPDGDECVLECPDPQRSHSEVRGTGGRREVERARSILRRVKELVARLPGRGARVGGFLVARAAH